MRFLDVGEMNEREIEEYGINPSIMARYTLKLERFLFKNRNKNQEDGK